jgi:hypothetical protein
MIASQMPAPNCMNCFYSHTEPMDNSRRCHFNPPTVVNGKGQAIYGVVSARTIPCGQYREADMVLDEQLTPTGAEEAGQQIAVPVMLKRPANEPPLEIAAPAAAAPTVKLPATVVQPSPAEGMSIAEAAQYVAPRMPANQRPVKVEPPRKG